MITTAGTSSQRQPKQHRRGLLTRLRNSGPAGVARAGVVLMATSALGVGVPDAAAAGRGDSVDPALMQPPLNPSFAPWECWQTGQGVTCEGARQLSYSGVETGLVCDGDAVYTTGTDERTQRRFGDASGLALRTVQHVDIRDVLSLSPDGSGPALRAVGHFQQWFDYPVPGDLSSRTETYTGLDVHISSPGVGLVVHDVGLKTFDIDGDVLEAHGPHPTIEDFEGSLAEVCDAFAALRE